MTAEEGSPPDLLELPIDIPLTLKLDAHNGGLLIEATVMRHSGAPMFLRLDLSPDAVSGFIEAFREVEDLLSLHVRPYRPARVLQ
jgi:hypothetical protein